MQLRHVKTIALKKSTKTKQSNGAYVDTFTSIKDYNCRFEELSDEISASIYGAKLDRTFRIYSIKEELETYLFSVLGEVSDYFVVYENKKYKIVSVKKHWVDIELIGNYEQGPVPSI